MLDCRGRTPGPLVPGPGLTGQGLFTSSEGIRFVTRGSFTAGKGSKVTVLRNAH